jgi:hypothetical protein
MLVNANDLSYSDKYKFITADDAIPPPEAFFDLKADPSATESLLQKYNYKVESSDVLQRWGDNVNNATLTYGPNLESELSKKEQNALRFLRGELDALIESQTWVQGELDWDENLWGEENKMARAFWPNGGQPDTTPVGVSVLGRTHEEDDFKVGLANYTPDTVFRYSVVIPLERNSCERLVDNAKDSILAMTITNSGVEQHQYTSRRNEKEYRGYIYSETAARPGYYCH